MSLLREALTDARISLRIHKHDPEALQRALNRLLTAHGNDTEALCLAGIMAPLAGDHRAWRVVDHRLGHRGDPALGYVAYMRLLDSRPQSWVREHWFHLVHASARRGYLPAVQLATEAAAPAKGLARTLYLAPFRLWWVILAQAYAWHDARDLRLPPSRRRQLG